MPNYRYQIKTAKGEVQVGVVAAESAAAASTILRNQGARVMAINVIAAGAERAALIQKLREMNAGRPKTRHVLDFTTQLAVMIRAGINLRAALEGIADQTEHASFKKIILGLKSDVESGKPASPLRAPELVTPDGRPLRAGLKAGRTRFNRALRRREGAAARGHRRRGHTTEVC